MITKMQSLIPKFTYFVIITTIIAATFSLSSYKSAIAGSTVTTVASFIINSTGSDVDKLFVDCNSDTPITSYDITVTNKKDNAISQVSVKYDIIVEFSESLPTGLTLSNGTTTIQSEEGKTTYLFSDVGNFNAGVEKSNKHTITLTGSNNVLSAYEGTMSIYVDATQID